MTDAITQLLHDGAVQPATGRSAQAPAPQGDRQRRAALPPKSRMRVVLGVLGLLVSLTLVGIATLAVTPIDEGYDDLLKKVLGVVHRAGVPEAFDLAAFTVTINIGMYVPLGLFLGLTLGRFLWFGVVLLPALSAGVEWAQGRLFDSAYSSAQDVIANSIGAVIGLLLAAILIAIVHKRDRDNIARARWELQPLGRQPRRNRLRIVIGGVLLVLCAVAVLAVTLSPTPVTEGNGDVINAVLRVSRRVGAPSTFTYSALEFVANIVMFLPVGFLIALLLPWRGVWTALLIVPAFSGAIELTQGAFLADRTPSLGDVAANTMGGWIGFLVAVIIRGVVVARDEKVIARALAA